jgi:hypothetical protein
VRAIENRDVVQRDPFFLRQPSEALDDEIGLFPVIHRLDDKGFLRIAAGRTQLLFEVPTLGLGEEHPVREVEDLRRGAIVGFNAMDDGSRMSVGECHDVLKVRSSP